jgi:hypothetical protein
LSTGVGKSGYPILILRRLATDLRSIAKDIEGVIAEIPATLLARADNVIE